MDGNSDIQVLPKRVPAEELVYVHNSSNAQYHEGSLPIVTSTLEYLISADVCSEDGSGEGGGGGVGGSAHIIYLSTHP